MVYASCHAQCSLHCETFERPNIMFKLQTQIRFGFPCLFLILIEVNLCVLDKLSAWELLLKMMNLIQIRTEKEKWTIITLDYLSKENLRTPNSLEPHHKEFDLLDIILQYEKYDWGKLQWEILHCINVQLSTKISTVEM